MSVKESPKIAVVGCGIIGLSSAVALQRAGYAVTIFAHGVPPDKTSDIAAAFWLTRRALPEEHTIPWSLRSFQTYRKIAEDKESGITLTPLRIYFPEREPDLLGPRGSMVRRARKRRTRSSAAQLRYAAAASSKSSRIVSAYARVEAPFASSGRCLWMGGR